MTTSSQNPDLTIKGKSSRRTVLKQAGLLASAIAGGLFATESFSANTSGNPVPLANPNPGSPRQGAVGDMLHNESRQLHLYNDHTNDEVKVVYYINGIYINEALAKLNHLMRDRRANIATRMDTTLYDQLFLLQNTVGSRGPVHILSGYRTPETNAKLRRRSSGVAKYSLHMEGRAADMYIPGIKVGELQKVARSLSAGGVGLYSASNFVHVDTGPIRHWGA